MDSQNPELVTAAASGPLTLLETKLHLGIDFSEKDALVQSYLDSAVMDFEDTTRRALVASTWDYTLPEWPIEDAIVLPKGQTVSVASVKYYLEDGTESIYPSQCYEVDLVTGEIRLKRDAAWPSAVLRVSRPIIIRFVAGWANAAAVPANIKTALLFRVQLSYDPQRNETEYRRLMEFWDRSILHWRLWK